MKSRSKNGNGLSKFRPATHNVNKHTAYGLGMLDRAMSEVGYVAPITVAADGESLDGSARLETAAIRFDGVEPIIVSSDGTRPIVHIRTDIPNAHTKKAKRIAIAANEIAYVDYAPDADIIAELAANERDVLDGLMSDERIEEIIGRNRNGIDGANIDDILAQWMILVECDNEAEQTQLLERFNEENIKCRALIS